jgi:catechol 2,3-dioxygenase-like lactoylglutathione lyase family enzyme
MQPQGILETVLYAEDLPAAEAFYRDVLGLEVYSSQDGRHVFFRCGEAMFLVFNPGVTSTQDVEVDDTTIPRHGCTGRGHVAFRVPEAELTQWERRLSDAGVPIETRIAWPQGGRSVYFRDPAGNSVELATPQLWKLD